MIQFVIVISAKKILFIGNNLLQSALKHKTTQLLNNALKVHTHVQKKLKDLHHFRYQR